MTENQIRTRKTMCIINGALKEHFEEMYVDPPKTVIRSDSYKKLSRFQIDQGIRAFSLATNLSGASMGDLDLYKLARAYLWDEEARKKINDVVDTHGF